MNTKGMENHRYLQTDESIQAAFWELMHKMPWSSISVQKIIDTARINRATFYYHYADTRDLLSRLENELMQKILRPLHLLRREAYIIGQHPLTTTLFRTFNEHREQVFLLLGPNGDAGFQSRMIREIVSILEQHWKSTFLEAGIPGHIANAYFSFLAGGTVSMMTRDSTSLSPEELGTVAGKMLVSINEIMLGYEK